MIVFFYEKVRLKRGVWQTVSIVLLIAFLCAFFTLFDGFICQKEQDMLKKREDIMMLLSITTKGKLSQRLGEIQNR